MSLENRKPSQGPPSKAAADIPEWWATVPRAERALIVAITRLLRSAKRSELEDVARAAAKWERGIGLFMKVRLIAACREAQRRKERDKERRSSPR